MSDLTFDVLEELRKIAKKDLDYDGVISPDQSLKTDLQLDSMGMIIVAVGLENRFRVKLQEEDAGALNTVNDLVQLVCRRVADRDNEGRGAEARSSPELAPDTRDNEGRGAEAKS